MCTSSIVLPLRHPIHVAKAAATVDLLSDGRLVLGVASGDGELDVLPKPTTETLPVFPTGHARQSVDWIADNGDGWLFYQLPDGTLRTYVDRWREYAGDIPFLIAARVSFADDPTADPEHRHLGYRAGVDWFRDYFRRLEGYGLDHVIVSPLGDGPGGR